MAKTQVNIAQITLLTISETMELWLPFPPSPQVPEEEEEEEEEEAVVEEEVKKSMLRGN